MAQWYQMRAISYNHGMKTSSARLLSALLLAAAAASLTGCGMLYTNIRAPRSYRTATSGDVKTSPADPVVSAEACSQSVLFLFSWGDMGYAAVVDKALDGKPGAVLYDVKFDMKVNSVLLGLYTKMCTKVSGRAAKL
jgi:hypothetical protein